MEDKPRLSHRRFITVTDWPKYHTWPSSSGLRHLIFNRCINGFSSVVRRCGRRVLIDEQAFYEWIDKNDRRKGC